MLIIQVLQDLATTGEFLSINKGLNMSSVKIGGIENEFADNV